MLKKICSRDDEVVGCFEFQMGWRMLGAPTDRVLKGLIRSPVCIVCVFCILLLISGVFLEFSIITPSAVKTPSCSRVLMEEQVFSLSFPVEFDKDRRVEDPKF